MTPTGLKSLRKDLFDGWPFLVAVLIGRVNKIATHIVMAWLTLLMLVGGAHALLTPAPASKTSPVDRYDIRGCANVPSRTMRPPASLLRSSSDDPRSLSHDSFRVPCGP